LLLPLTVYAIRPDWQAFASRCKAPQIMQKFCIIRSRMQNPGERGVDRPVVPLEQPARSLLRRLALTLSLPHGSDRVESVSGWWFLLMGTKCRRQVQGLRHRVLCTGCHWAQGRLRCQEATSFLAA